MKSPSRQDIERTLNRLTEEELQALRERIKVAFEKNKKWREENCCPPANPPRYDEVYWKGLEWLDKL